MNKILTFCVKQKFNNYAVSVPILLQCDAGDRANSSGHWPRHGHSWSGHVYPQQETARSAQCPLCESTSVSVYQRWQFLLSLKIYWADKTISIATRLVMIYDNHTIHQAMLILPMPIMRSSYLQLYQR